MKLLTWALITIITFLFIYNTSIKLLKNPTIWPDEALFADISWQWLQTGKIKSELWSNGLLPGAEKTIAYYPPFYFYTIGIFFKIWGEISIHVQRWLSVVFSLISIGVLTIWLKRYLKTNNHWLIIIFLIGVFTDIYFSQGSKLGRPEALILMLGIFSLWTWQNIKTKKYFIYISGLFSGLAVLTHPLGLIFPFIITIDQIIKNKIQTFKSRNYLSFITITIIPLTIWFLNTIIPNWQIFSQQFSLHTVRVNQIGPLLSSLLKTGELIQIQHLCYWLIISIFIYQNWPQTKYRLILLSLITTSLVSIIAKDAWYILYPLPFIYLSAVILISQIKNYRSIASKTVQLSLITIISISIYTQLNLYLKNRGENFNYQPYIQFISDQIPANQSILLTSLPDPYYGLIKENKNYQIREFPSVNIEPQVYKDLLDQTDYIVYNHHLGHPEHDQFLKNYIKQNLDQQYVYKPGSNQYQTSVIKLLPKNIRK